ncbi:MAG: hydroxyacid dehydrogenase [Gemmatimonadetes bacterium]|nr:hydroxyacid dehydrogenase [Gemmatimonadota bacterium]
MITIAVTDTFPPFLYDAMRDAGWNPVDGTSWSAEELPDRLNESKARAILVRSRTKVTRDLMNAVPGLRIVARGGVGLDNVDQEAAREKGIAVLNTPGASAGAVAELVILFLLAIARKLPVADAGIKAGRWEKKYLRGVEIAGRTLGIAGFGNIGRVVANRALGMGMKVIWFDPAPIDPGELGAVTREVSWDELLKESDFITLHIPLLDATRHLMNEDAFAKMKPGAGLVHCARGGVVDEQALAEALRSGRLSGAGLDVFETEPPGDSPLWDCPGVVATPHVGASTEEAQRRVSLEIADRIVHTWKEIGD